MQRLLHLVGAAPVSPLRAALLRRSLGLFGLALVAATWRLWTPQTVFPQVPLFHAAGALPDWCQWLAAGVMVAGLAGALVAPSGRWARVALVAYAAAAGGMMLVDQQRMQPWAYQFILLALVLVLAEPRAAFALLRLLIVSFYFYSALTKFDYAFLHTLGQQFLTAVLEPCGVSPETWSPAVRLAAAAAFPVGEMLVAVALFFAPTRKVGLAGAVFLHVLLLVILGPWGLDHKPAVLLWNAYFIVQDLLLFWPTRAASADEPDGTPGEAPPLVVSKMATTLVAAAIVLPALEPFGWFDMWPSWGLYAASAERVALEVHRRELDDWPAELRAYLEQPDDPGDPWLRVRLDRWSLDAVGAPIYPQNRVQLGVAAGVIQRFGLGHRARVVRFDQAARLTGRRNYVVFRSLPQLEAAADEYFLGARPRDNLD